VPPVMMPAMVPPDWLKAERQDAAGTQRARVVPVALVKAPISLTKRPGPPLDMSNVEPEAARKGDARPAQQRRGGGSK